MVQYSENTSHQNACYRYAEVGGSVILSICDMVSVNFALWWVLVQYMVVFFVCKQTLDKIDSNGGKLRQFSPSPANSFCKSLLLLISSMLRGVSRVRFLASASEPPDVMVRQMRLNSELLPKTSRSKE